MSKKISIIKEIQELVQEIETNYQEGVDFQKPYWSLGKYKIGAITYLSPRLRSFLRKKFDFPAGFNDYLDYSKTDLSGNNYYYRLDGEHGKGELEGLYFRHSNKGLERNQPKKCKQCGELTLEEEGRLWLWNEKTVGKDFGQDSKVIAYFHPNCAKKYFADQEQPIQSDNSQIKEKLLRNLDKISLDPIGYLANAEIIKGNEVEENYNSGKVNSSDWSAWNDKVRQVEIGGEKINLTELSWADKLAVRKAIIAAIKSNPQDWKIENSSIYANPSQGIPDSFKILRHKSGRRHWNVGILHLNESYGQGQKDWAEIEALLSGSTVPEFNNNKNNSISDTEKEQIKQYFLKNDIKEVKLINGELIITHNNNNETKNLQQIFHDSKLLEIMNYCQRNNEEKITRTSLGLGSNNTNSEPNKGNHHLAIGLALGAGAVILVGVIAYFIRKRKNK